MQNLLTMLQRGKVELTAFNLVENMSIVIDKAVENRQSTRSFYPDGLEHWQIQHHQRNALDRQIFIAHVM